MENQPKHLTEAIKNFKKMFSEAQAAAFKSLEIDIMTAIEEYGNDQSADADITFRPNRDREYPRDKASQINLTTVSVAINLIAKDAPDYDILINNLVPIHEALDELKEDITLFIQHDHNQERKMIYKNGLDYLDKIGSVLFPLS
jgi:hypothetical protein